jgi:hypothetical protein
MLHERAPRWKPWVAPLAIMAVACAVQFANIGKYGATWDEPLHRNWAKQFIAFWETGDAQRLEEMPGRGMYYGPSYYLANYHVSQFAAHRLGMTFTPSNHLFGVIVTSIALGILFAFVRSAAGARVAWLSTLYPQLIAHAQYNPKDIPVLVVSIPLMAAFHLAVTRRTKRWAAATGFIFGVGFALKLTILILLPVLAALWLGSFVRAARVPGARLGMLLRNDALLGLLFSVAAVAGMYAAWPTLWFKPLLFKDALHIFTTEEFWHGEVMYFGTRYIGSQLPWHYIPFMFFMATPLLTLACMAVGTAVAARRGLRTQGWTFYALVLLWFWLPLAFSLKPGLVRYDGIRQFLFCIPPLAILAGIGLDRLLSAAGKKIPWKPLPVVLAAFVFLWLGVEIARVHPIEGSYVNESVRVAIPRDIHMHFELEYWGATYRQGADWIAENVRPGEIVCVPIADYLILWYEWPEGIRFGCTKDAKYVMFFTRYSQEYRKKFDVLTPAFAVERYNTPLLLLYKVR